MNAEAAGNAEFQAAKSDAVSGVSSPPTALKPSWYYLIFAASGFAGLIYESVWARYLKLFLGNAAYAQALVIVVFLLGLALGSLLCARVSSRLARPLLWYVGVEVIVALTAVYFHDIFTFVQYWGIDVALPSMASDVTAEWFKWGLAFLLIFPQSVLLGATFPLMGAAVIRLFPVSPGRVVSLLYFSNSLGAAVGVLFGGFVLIPQLGLPGTVVVAGLINAVVAAVVWFLGKRFNDVGAPVLAAPSGESPTGAPSLTGLILTAAFVTGVASFIYEIIWVRMLALLLGSSTHNFELMLSAFILGLAIGGFWVRRRADSGGEVLSLLGTIQLLMGALALWSLFAFPLIYDILHTVLRDIQRDGVGYALFMVLALMLSMLMMLPATICAGMTLPLLTRRLMNAGGEAAVGRVYAANTAGAIVGVLVTVHWLLPTAGLQLSLLAAAALDMGLGLVLFMIVAKRRLFAGVPATAAMLVAALLFGKINPQLAAAGVFRHQKENLPIVVYQAQGKTASIAVTETAAEQGKVIRSISTNGKTDAALIYEKTIDENRGIYRGDEMTMTVLGLLPLLFNPQAKTAMNIGFGSGLSSRVLLASPALQRLDNVEIEVKMLEGARWLGERVAPVFDDERNHFIINDAKTVLARAVGKYDIILSVPSNPWVSGVSSLFTREFYRRVRLALAGDGVFVQWLPLYESNPLMLSSVVRALSSEFSDFAAYVSNGGSDLIFVAAPADSLPPPQAAIFADDDARDLLAGYGFHSVADAAVLSMGDRRLLLPYFLSFPSPINSDYHPFLENRAFRAFFNRTRYTVGELPLLPVPVLEMAGAPPYSFDNVSRMSHSHIAAKAKSAQKIYDERFLSDGYVRRRLAQLAQRLCPTPEEGDPDGYLELLSSFISLLMPQTEKEKMAVIWELLETDACLSSLLQRDDDIFALYAQFWRALSLRDGEELVRLTEALLPHANLLEQSGQILMLAAVAGHYQQGNYNRVVFMVQDMPVVAAVIHHAARLLAANAAEKI